MTATLPSALPEARLLQYGVCQVTIADVRVPIEKDRLPSLHAKRMSYPNRPIHLHWTWLWRHFHGIGSDCRSWERFTTYMEFYCWYCFLINSILVFRDCAISSHSAAWKISRRAASFQQDEEIWYGSKFLKDQRSLSYKRTKLKSHWFAFVKSIPLWSNWKNHNLGYVPYMKLFNITYSEHGSLEASDCWQNSWQKHGLFHCKQLCWHRGSEL